MKILVIGGSRFVGWHLVQAALEHGHEVTVFNRGRTAPAPAGVVQITGDRRADLSVLRGSTWDAVIDTCGYLPREVASMAAALADAVQTCLFVSSVSVYAGFEAPNDERSALGTIDDADTDVVDGRTYGPLKALCEHEIRARFGAQRSLVVRPGLVVGPRDPTQRFTYWPARVARTVDDEPVLLPGSADDRLQFIDVRDLAAFMLGLVESGRAGVFNATSAPGAFTMGGLWQACCAATGRRPRAVWTDADAVERLGLKPWSDLPVWLPARGDSAAFGLTAIDAALAAGLKLRPLKDTVADTLAWWRSLAPDQQAITLAGLSPEREAAALQALT
jgi:2'-hydroxyisoflavone reductase